jgi:hypothetical protein
VLARAEITIILRVLSQGPLGAPGAFCFRCKKAAPGGHLGAALTANMSFVNRQIIACLIQRVNSSLDIHAAVSNPLML